jgi:predicted nucleic acid-binding protein
LTAADWRRCSELIERHDDLGLGVVDSSIVAVAERLGASTIATLNHRDFAVVRPVHVAAFELLP